MSTWTAPKTLLYLQSVRSPVGKANPDLVDHLANGYKAVLPILQRDYERWAGRHRFDLVLAVPSSRNDSQTFLNILKKANPNAIDYSDCFFKDPDWRSGSGHNLQDAIKHIKIQNNPDFIPYHRIAVIDETISTGNSIAAMIHHMRSHGLNEAVEIWLVVPLCMMNLTYPP